jgi:uncharacterized OB-fold protein
MNFGPIPTPSASCLPFWEAAAEGKLVIPRCSHCGHYEWVPQEFCSSCGAWKFSWEPMSGCGKVYSYSIVHAAQVPGLETPYALAIVRLDEGVDLLTNIVGCPVEDVQVGMRVAVQFMRRGDYWIYPFQPA